MLKYFRKDSQYYAPLRRDEGLEDAGLHFDSKPLIRDRDDSSPPSSPDILTPRLSRSSSNSFRSRNLSISFFFIACTLSLIASTINVTFLSMKGTYNSLKMPTKKPTVYLGLDRVKYNHTLCRNRVTFPAAYSVAPSSDLKSSKKMEAPGDIITLSFGEDVSAIADFYIPDYGLENCTLSTQVSRNYTMPTPGPWAVELWRLDSPDPGSSKRFIDTLHFAPKLQSTSVPFWCPSRQHTLVELRCPQEGCKIEFLLQGVTDLTPLPRTRSQTGFKVRHWEDLSCIPSV